MIKRTLLLFIPLVFLPVSELSSQLTFIGASANYGSWIKEIGVSVHSIYSVNKKIDIVPNATYFFPHQEIIDTQLDTGTVTYTWWSFNVDGHYVVFEKSVFQFFGMIGLNITNETKLEEYNTWGQPFKNKTVTTKPALNIGAGVQFQLSKFFTPFVEIKYVLGKRDQAVATLGFMFRIKPDRKGEEE